MSDTKESALKRLRDAMGVTCIKNMTPKEISDTFQSLHDKAQQLQARCDELERERDGLLAHLKLIDDNISDAMSSCGMPLSEGQKMMRVSEIFIEQMPLVLGGDVFKSLSQLKAETIASLKFPTMLRKMWSGKEVQEWINEQAKIVKDSES